jgi:cyclopropane fatty-acyl-phospholipid synthase-like methyltransferase
MGMRKFFHFCLLYGACNFLYGDATNFSSLEDEYTPTYCLQLEAAYGEGMMSEGGVEGIEHMFNSISLEKKKALDIGSGLGGVAFYLADKFSMEVTGIEVNQWMVREAKKRVPMHLKDRVDFCLISANTGWPFFPETYDIIYSKGVLTHVEDKEEIFQECHRVLKKGGYLVITDWLSSEERKWGENIGRLVELENLVLFPENRTNYIEQLKKRGYRLVSVRDDSAMYYRFNKQIIDRLQTPSPALDQLFNESERNASIEGYESIAKALEIGELQVVCFIAQKE